MPVLPAERLVQMMEAVAKPIALASRLPLRQPRIEHHDAPHVLSARGQAIRQRERHDPAKGPAAEHVGAASGRRRNVAPQKSDQASTVRGKFRGHSLAGGEIP